MNVIKRILALEPVAVQGVVRLAFVLLATVGVTVSDEVSGQALAFVAAAYALVEAVTSLWARSKVTPTVTVVEKIDSAGDKVAGPANEVLPEGTVI